MTEAVEKNGDSKRGEGQAGEAKMTGTVIIACRVLEDELGMVFKELGYSLSLIHI